jgi:hypothetical protein
MDQKYLLSVIHDFQSNLQVITSDFENNLAKFDDKRTKQLDKMLKELNREAKFFLRKLNRELTLDNLVLTNNKLSHLSTKLTGKYQAAKDLMKELQQQERDKPKSYLAMAYNYGSSIFLSMFGASNSIASTQTQSAGVELKQ